MWTLLPARIATDDATEGRQHAHQQAAGEETQSDQTLTHQRLLQEAVVEPLGSCLAKST